MNMKDKREQNYENDQYSTGQKIDNGSERKISERRIRR